jgi:hypothetical protein
MKYGELNERAENELLDQVVPALSGESGIVLRAASTALRKYASQSKENARKVRGVLISLPSSERPEVLSLLEETKILTES